MSEVKRVYIWPVETGILPLPPEAAEVQNNALRLAIGRWTEVRKQVEDLEGYQEFVAKLRRAWSIYTGSIEGAYTLTRGLTLSMVEDGYQVVYERQDESDTPPEDLTLLLETQERCIDKLFAFVKRERNLTPGFIKELHEILTHLKSTYEAVRPDGKTVDVPLDHGVWKRFPNSPYRDGIRYEYCPPEHVASEVDRLCEMYEELRRRETLPEVLSAWLHHRFTQIHPFADGNGRVARALAALVLIQHRLFPMPISEEIAKRFYIPALERADDGDLRPLIYLFARLQRETIEKAISLSRTLIKEYPTAAEAARSIGEYLAGTQDIDDWARERRTLGSVLSYANIQTELEAAIGYMRESMPRTRWHEIKVQQEGNPAPFPYIELTRNMAVSGIFEDILDPDGASLEVNVINLLVKEQYTYYFCSYFSATSSGPVPTFMIVRDGFPGFRGVGPSLTWSEGMEKSEFQRNVQEWSALASTAIMNDLYSRIVLT